MRIMTAYTPKYVIKVLGCAVLCASVSRSGQPPPWPPEDLPARAFHLSEENDIPATPRTRLASFTDCGKQCVAVFKNVSFRARQKCVHLSVLSLIK